MRLASVKKALLRQLAAIRAAAPRVTVRTLDAGDIDLLLRDVKAALKAARPDDVRLEARATGGYVPNAYGYSGDSDRAEVTLDLVTEAVTSATLVRGHADSRPYGRGPCRIVRLARAGQTYGRIVS